VTGGLNPTASFTGTPLTGVAPLGVTFTDGSAGTSIINRTWNFGDGNVSVYTSSTNPYHIYASVGTYSVNLTVVNASGSNSQLRTNYITATTGAVVSSGTNVGIFRDASGTWYLDNTKTGAVNKTFQFGKSGDTAVVGDWNNDGTTNAGVFRPASGTWYLDTTKTGVVNKTFQFGKSGDIAVVGDWNNDGTTNVGVFRPDSGTWYLDTTKTGVVNKTFQFGKSGDIAVVGDWNNDGTTNVGVFRPDTGTWYLDTTNTGVVNRTFQFGKSGDVPVVGEWN
jgi:PKD repeat protein